MTSRAASIGAGFALAILTTASFGQASLELPQSNTTQSGIGVISGWSCAGNVQVVIDGTPYTVGYGTSRGDAATQCAGNANVGFALAINYNSLGAGSHSAQLRVGGANVGAPVPFKVVVPQNEFATGLSGTVTVNGFPSSSKSVTLQWQESQQNFAIVAVTSTSAGGFPITFKGIRIDSLTFAAGEEGRTCDATLSFTNTTSATHFAALYFDVMQGGGVKDQVIFPAFDLEAGKSGSFTTTVVIGAELAKCGDFTLQFNSSDSIVF